ncbi:MAG TPA: ribbon-helix-helix protein, CopG family [Terriglobia bacterium]|nr:ribbon-helix-helix protein, CopG family [Terriglobia bacterium]
MGIRRRRSSRVFTISFPEDLAKQVDKVAKEESRNTSELFREAFRSYRMERVRRRLQADREYARTRNPKGYGEADVESLVDEVRAEIHAKKKDQK